MAQMNMVQAINDGLRVEMRRNPSVVVLGEDVGKVGGVFRVTQGRFRRVRREPGDRHASLERGGDQLEAAVGMALYGMYPGARDLTSSRTSTPRRSTRSCPK